LAQEAGDEISAQVKRAWQLAYGRMPSDQELAGATAFVQAATTQFEAAGSADSKTESARSHEQRALAVFCQTLLSSNEFLYVN
jgi:hypothetical protein